VPTLSYPLSLHDALPIYVKAAGFETGGVAQVNHVGGVQIILQVDLRTETRFAAVTINRVVGFNVEQTKQAVVGIRRCANRQGGAIRCNVILATAGLFVFRGVTSTQGQMPLISNIPGYLCEDGCKVALLLKVSITG